MRIKCTKPIVCVYDFMRLLCASLIQQGKVFVDFSDIADKIFLFRETLPASELFIFDDIEFRCNIDGQTNSDDIYQCLLVLQELGFLSSENKTYDHAIIHLVSEEAEAILQSCDKQIADTLENLAKFLCTM